MQDQYACCSRSLAYVRFFLSFFLTFERCARVRFEGDGVEGYAFRDVFVRERGREAVVNSRSVDI